MHQLPQGRACGEQAVSSQLNPNPSGIFSRIQDSTKCLSQRPRSPNRHKPQPHYARCIRTNSRFINEPFAYMETKATMSDQFQWMTHETPSLMQHIPSYSLESTQRHDFQNLVSKPNPQTRHGCNPNKYPCSGIVPQVDTSELVSPPRVYREFISFIHQYDARKYPNEPIRGKRHGAFVCTEINSQSGKIAPRGTETFLVTRGSHSLEHLKEKGNLRKNTLASARPSSTNSQQMLCLGTCLSKPDPEETAKGYPRIPAEGQSSLWSQKGKTKSGVRDQHQIAADHSVSKQQKNDHAGTKLPQSSPPAPSLLLQTNSSLVPFNNNNTKDKLTSISI
ncbi:ciliary microtubule inner protein 6-like [Hemitrygon akajei]|uniref:ciliary microtubule inner protein 6-like n=1 Tax=Hemitrygon akajei TaxID=2704970 RepID=UPI003BF9C763